MECVQSIPNAISNEYHYRIAQTRNNGPALANNSAGTSLLKVARLNSMQFWVRYSFSFGHIVIIPKSLKSDSIPNRPDLCIDTVQQVDLRYLCCISSF